MKEVALTTAAERLDIAVVFGGERGVWDDLAALVAIYGRPWDGIVIAANDVGTILPRVDHWVSLHPELFHGNKRRVGWITTRKRNGLPDGFTTWCQWRRKGGRVDRRLEGQPRMTGSSGLLATKVALEVCRGPVILCGIPMTRTTYFEESVAHPTGKVWNSVDSHWRAWVDPQMTERLRLRVRSMSGRTRELLGGPTREWFDSWEDANDGDT